MSLVFHCHEGVRLNCKGIWADNLDLLYPKKCKYPGSPWITSRCRVLKSRCSALFISTVSGCARWVYLSKRTSNNSYFAAHGSHRVANITQGPRLIAHIITSCQVHLKTGPLCAKINTVSTVTIAPLSCRLLCSHSVGRLRAAADVMRGVGLKWKTS